MVIGWLYTELVYGMWMSNRCSAHHDVIRLCMVCRFMYDHNFLSNKMKNVSQREGWEATNELILLSSKSR